jgi:hypothetical protein
MVGSSKVALHAVAALALLIGSSPRRASAQVAVSQTAPVAVVVLIAEAAESSALRDVIAELLARQGVQPQFEASQRFEPDAWLEQNPADARTFAFVSVRQPERAQLYLRGPRGERFMLRELALRAGLDELGRELIARVVETAVVALLHSDEGLNREQARAGLAQESQLALAAPVAAADEPPATPPRAASAEASERWRALLGLRSLVRYSGPDLGVLGAFGLEAGVALHEPGWPRLRARLSVEASLPQRLDAAGVEAKLVSIPMRLGIDVGTAFGLYLGLSTGFDLVHLDPEQASDDALSLTKNSMDLVPATRFELRYELALGSSACLGLSAFADAAWTATHYDVVENGTITHLATPWRVQPGVALSVGWLP